MFASDLVLDDADGTDQTFRLRSQDGSGSIRIDIASDLRAPRQLAIRHSVNGKGSDATDRHLVQLSRVVVDSTGKAVTHTLNVTSSVPRNSALTPQMVYDDFATILDFLSDGALTTALSDTDAIASLLRGES